MHKSQVNSFCNQIVLASLGMCLLDTHCNSNVLMIERNDQHYKHCNALIQTQMSNSQLNKLCTLFAQIDVDSGLLGNCHNYSGHWQVRKCLRCMLYTGKSMCFPKHKRFHYFSMFRLGMLYTQNWYGPKSKSNCLHHTM